MRCPECGAWNAAYLPNCTRCGAPLPENSSERAAWEDALHDKKPSLRITKYDEDDPAEEQQPAADAPYDPETVDASALTDEVEELMTRRQRGEQRLNALRERASDVRRALRETEVIRPHTEDEDESAPGAREGDAAMPPARTRSGARREILVYAVEPVGKGAEYAGRIYTLLLILLLRKQQVDIRPRLPLILFA